MELKHNTQLTVHCSIHLLIVPYGIETMLRDADRKIPNPFNRTLWN